MFPKKLETSQGHIVSLVELNGDKSDIKNAEVFIHGYPDSWKSWKPLMDCYDKSNKHIVLFDLPGFGESEEPESMNRNIMFQFIKDEIIGLCEGQHVTLIGHSVGSVIAREFAATFPTAIHKLILISPTHNFYLSPLNDHLTMEILHLDEGEETKKEFITNVTEDMFPDHFDSENEIFQHIIAERMKTSGYALRKFTHLVMPLPFRRKPGSSDNLVALSQTIESSALGDWKTKIKCPTLLICARHDKMFPIDEHALVMLDMLQGTDKKDVVVLENAGHYCHWDEPVLVAECIAKFTKKNDDKVVFVGKDGIEKMKALIGTFADADSSDESDSDSDTESDIEEKMKKITKNLKKMKKKCKKYKKKIYKLKEKKRKKRIYKGVKGKITGKLTESLKRIFEK